MQRHSSETYFIVEICLFLELGAPPGRVYLFGVCRSLKLGFRLLESYLKFTNATSARGLGFFTLYNYGAFCIALVFICGTVLKQRLVKGKCCGDLFEPDWLILNGGAFCAFRPAGALRSRCSSWWCLSSGLLQPIMNISSLSNENLCLSFWHYLFVIRPLQI